MVFIGHPCKTLRKSSLDHLRLLLESAAATGDDDDLTRQGAFVGLTACKKGFPFCLCEGLGFVFRACCFFHWGGGGD